MLLTIFACKFDKLVFYRPLPSPDVQTMLEFLAPLVRDPFVQVEVALASCPGISETVICLFTKQNILLQAKRCGRFVSD